MECKLLNLHGKQMSILIQKLVSKIYNFMLFYRIVQDRKSFQTIDCLGIKVPFCTTKKYVNCLETALLHPVFLSSQVKAIEIHVLTGNLSSCESVTLLISRGRRNSNNCSKVVVLRYVLEYVSKLLFSFRNHNCHHQFISIQVKSAGINSYETIYRFGTEFIQRNPTIGTLVGTVVTNCGSIAVIFKNSHIMGHHGIQPWIDGADIRCNHYSQSVYLALALEKVEILEYISSCGVVYYASLKAAFPRLLDRALEIIIDMLHLENHITLVDKPRRCITNNLYPRDGLPTRYSFKNIRDAWLFEEFKILTLCKHYTPGNLLTNVPESVYRCMTLYYDSPC